MEMKLENFFSRLFARKKQDERIEVVIDQKAIAPVAKTISTTVLAFTEDQEKQYTGHEKEALREKLEALPPLTIGEVNFVPVDLSEIYGGYFVTVFVRNGLDLEDEITFREIPLCLVDAAGDKVACGVFRPEKFGSIRFGEARVWNFAWRKEQVVKENPDLSTFTVAIDIK